MMNELTLSDTVLKTEKITGYLWLMFILCFFGNVLAGTASTLMSVYLPVVVKDLLGQTDYEQLNSVGPFINALYFVGWAIGGFTWGVMGDRIGRARSLALSVSMYGLFTLLCSWASGWELMLLFRFFCGFGVGGVLVINTTLLSEVWPDRTKAVFIGILSIGFPVGIFSSGAVNYFVSVWRHGFLIGAVPLAVGIVSFWILRESEKWEATRTQKGQENVSLRPYRAELVNGSIVFGSMLIGLWAIFSWLPTWVQSLLHGSDGQNERAISMMLLGAAGLSGGFFSGWISNSMGMRRAMLVCFAGCFVFSFLLFRLNTEFSIITMVEIALLSFTFGISQGLLAVYIPLLFPVAIRATATGFCFNVGRFFTAAAVFFVGALVTALGGYGNSLFTFSLVFLVGFLILLFSKKMGK